MPNLISSQQALEALQSGPCRVAREAWPWGKWIETIMLPDGNPHLCVFNESNLCCEEFWEPEFADHSAVDWYVLEPTEAECENSMRLGHNQLLPEYP